VKKLRVPIDRDAVIRNGVVDESDYDRIVDEHIIDMSSTSMLSKRDIMVLDLIAHNNWERPIYFSITVGSSPKDYFWLTDYFRLEGLAYRYVPIKNPEQSQGYNYGFVDTDRMYDNLMNKFEFGNANDPSVYLDETNRRMASNFRNIYARLGLALARKGEKERAVEVLDRIMDEMPEHSYPFNFFIMGIIEAYYQAGAIEKGNALVETFADRLESELRYYQKFSGSKRKALSSEISQASQYFQYLVSINARFGGQENIQNSELFKRYQQFAQ
jgi:tetratricopeptide (TPR) repeat protein